MIIIPVLYQQYRHNFCIIEYMYKKTSENYLWYIRNNGAVTGPFTIGMIHRFVLVGRLKMDSEVSQDKKTWATIALTPITIPDEMKNIRTDTDHERLLQAQLREDERGKDRRRADLDEFMGRRAPNDRRKIENVNTRVHRDVRSKVNEDYVPEDKKMFSMLISFALVISLLLTGVYVFRESGQQMESRSDCKSAAAVGVNWSHCHMEGKVLSGYDLERSNLNNVNFAGAVMVATKLGNSDLAYSNLSIASMIGAKLNQSSLKGVNFRGADLREVDFTDADLSYADFTNAKITNANFAGVTLHNTVWINGQECNSIKECSSLMKNIKHK